MIPFPFLLSILTRYKNTSGWRLENRKNTCENTRKRLKNLKTSTLMNIFSFILDKKNNQCLLNKYLQFGEGVIVMPSSYNPRK